jgi:CBS domain-containing protein
MSLKNFATKLDKISCEENARMIDVATLMRDEGVGAVLVEKDKKPVGMITDRDLVTRCIAGNEDFSRLKAKDVMTKPVNTISANASILDLIEEMKNDHVRRACIVDSSGRTVGIVSMADVFELLAHELGQLSEALGVRNEKLFRRTRAAG